MKNNSKKRKKISLKVFILFIVFEFVFTAVTIPFVVFYGPFKNVKRTVVGAAMTTLSHQFIAKTFLSDKQINEILSEDGVVSIEQGSQQLQFNNTHDSSIDRYDIDGKKFKGYMLVIHDPTRVKVGVSSKLGTEGQLTSQIAKNNNAVAAINGGGFTDKSANSTWTGTGGTPVGIIMSDGEEKYNDITNSNSRRDVMAITKGGVLLVGPHSINEMKNLGVTDAISFGPALIVNGKITVKGDGGWGIAPRTAIGQKKDGSILMLVIDGRQVSSLGATIKDAAEVMKQYGAYNATNLDGGSSSTMYYEDEVINNPCDPLGERSVPSIVYVKP
jgi:exopolysaccharide biosynthesis protein